MGRSAKVDSLAAQAIERAQKGIPTVLDVEGHAGFGKTHLARAIAAKFPSRDVLRATAYEDTQSDPLGLLEQLGVDLDGVSSNALSASRALGARLDGLREEGLSEEGLLVVVLDDLHWADPESIDAVGVLMERLVGIRCLVVAGHRPIGHRHLRWVSLLHRAPSVVRVVLDGLDDDATLDLLRASSPDATLGLAQALRAHTGGSPLFLQSLLREYSTGQLQQLVEGDKLPATREIVAAMGERLGRLDPAAVATLSAIAVIGGDGADPGLIANLTDGADVSSALDLLDQEGLVVIERTGMAPRARVFHGVVRAAVYDNIPPATRERMHRVAAARAVSQGERLRHRVAAAHGVDDGLAADLRAHAGALHERGRYREAARFLRQAVRSSATPEAASRHVLEADMESIFALDLDDVSVQESEVPLTPQARVVVGMKLAAQNRFVESSDILGALTEIDFAGLDALTAYRARVMRAWSMVAAGRSAESALKDLAIADAGSVSDDAVSGYAAVTRGQAAQRAAPVSERMTLRGLLSVDRATMAATTEGTIGLAWRGAVMSLTGLPREAIGDLSLVTSRFADGLMDFRDGVFHGLLGFAYFINGQWPRAAMMIDLARAGRFMYPSPLTTAIEPLIAVVANDPDRARSAMARARTIRIRGPHPAAVHAGDIVDVLTLFFLDDPSEQAGWLEGRTSDLGSPDDLAEEQVPHLWYVAQAIGAHWAGRPQDVPRWAELLRTVDPPPWSNEVADWLEARVDRSPGGTRHVLELADHGLSQLPAIDVMIQYDAALRRTSDSADAVRRRRAASALRRIGAEHLAEHLDRDTPERAAVPSGTSGTSVPSGTSVLSTLSEREREVAALILEGLSYQQAAKELFVTRSTISFHLSRIYAKTGTSSRHQLIEAVRANTR